MIQQKLEQQEYVSPGFVSALVNALKSTFADAMANQFGNYLCQKIIEVSSKVELQIIVDAVAPKAAAISLSVHGTRAMQTLVETLAQNIKGLEVQCRRLIQEVDFEILQLSTHVNGNHVI